MAEFHTWQVAGKTIFGKRPCQFPLFIAQRQMLFLKTFFFFSFSKVKGLENAMVNSTHVT